MTWTDRLREPSYTSPSGERFTFDYTNVSNSFDKKTTGFEFANINGTYVQDLGSSGRRLPFRFIFNGPDYDLEATAFMTALSETGIAKFEHPNYGTRDVIPFGTVERNDELVTAGNQAIITVTLWETIGLEFPDPQTNPQSQIVEAVEQYNEASAQQLNDVLNTDEGSLRNFYQSLVDETKEALQVVADVQDDVRQQFEAINESINEGIDVLIQQPLTLAFQTAILIQAPARALALIEDRLQAFGNLAESIIGQSTDIDNFGTNIKASNDFHLRDLFASSNMTGSVLSTINNTFTTRTEAITSADVILNQLDQLVEWRDETFSELEQIDTGGTYRQLLKCVALAAGYLVTSSFTLKQERRITLQRNRTIIDLCAELYGRIDEELDTFIDINNLSGSEILELPKGREIVYYV